MPKVAVFVGSLRQQSVNRAFAQALAKLAAPKLDFVFSELGDIPHFNQDQEKAPPPAVQRLKREIDAADAVLFVTPEYNRSFSASLKTVLEWGSRPWGENQWPGMPAAIVGASPGAIGTAVAQAQLRSVVTHLGMPLLAQPEVYIQFKPELIGENGEIAPESTRKFLGQWVDAFAHWIERNNSAAAA